MSKKASPKTNSVVAVRTPESLEIRVPIANSRPLGLLNQPGNRLDFKTALDKGLTMTYAQGNLVLRSLGTTPTDIEDQLLRIMHRRFVDMAMSVLNGPESITLELPAATIKSIISKASRPVSSINATAFAGMSLDSLHQLHRNSREVHPIRTPRKNTYKIVIPGFARNAERRNAPMGLPA